MHRHLPAQARLEVAEYVSLLRALRVQHTLDLTAHLLAPADPRPHWSTWPLHPDDVVVPQWSLRDEVSAFAASIVSPNPAFVPTTSPRPAVEQAHDRELDDNTDDLEPLPDLVTSFLSSILTILAHHVSTHSDGTRARTAPVGWQTVVNVLAGGIHASEHGLVNLELLERTRQRLEHIYGPAPMRFMDQPMRAEPAKYIHDFLATRVMARELILDPGDGLPDIPPPTEEMERSLKRNRDLEAEEKLVRAQWSDSSNSEDEHRNDVSTYSDSEQDTSGAASSPDQCSDRNANYKKTPLDHCSDSEDEDELPVPEKMQKPPPSSPVKSTCSDSEGEYDSQ